MTPAFRAPRTPLILPGEIDLHERDMTATFSADVSLRVAQIRLGEIGQWLPIDGDPERPIGHLVDINSTGPLRLGFGAWRDLLLGVQFINGRGELITAGGRTVKNVAGYDLTKFMVGQRGVFGTLVSVTTRTYRRPAGAVLAEFAPGSVRLNDLLPTPLKPQWIVITAAAIYIGYLGDERSLDFYRRQLPGLSPASIVSRTVDEDIAHRQLLWSCGGEAFRASVAPSAISQFVARAGINRWAADAAFGIVVGNFPAGGLEALAKAARDVGGSVITCDRSAATKVAFSGLTAVERDILAKLKNAFDPGKTLNAVPGAVRLPSELVS